MRVERVAVHDVEAAVYQRSQLWGNGRTPGEGGIDVHPRAVLMSESGDLSYWIDSGRRCRSNRAYDEERNVAVGNILGHGFGQPTASHGKLAINVDAAKLIVAKPGNPHALEHRRVRLV
jgi:hypothetical protein